MATSTLIDLVRFAVPCVDITFNETGEYFASCHKGHKAIYMWANKTFFTTDSFTDDMTMVTEKKLSLPSLIGITPSTDVRLTSIQKTSEENETGGYKVVVIDDEEENEGFDEEIQSMHSIQISDSSKLMGQVSMEQQARQLAPDLVTLSGLAPSRWANLPNLDLIRTRNKPIEPPKKPKNAPFFLPATETLEGFAFEKHEGTVPIAEEENTTDKEMIAAKRRLDDLESIWAEQLMNANSNADFLQAFDELKTMNISSIDFQIKALNRAAFANFLQMLCVVLETRKNFELAQSYLATFLNAHRESIWKITQPEIKDKEEVGEDARKCYEQRLSEMLEKIFRLQHEIWPNVQELLDANLSLSQWIKSALL